MVTKTSLFSIAAMATIGLAMSVGAQAQISTVQNFSVPMQRLPFTNTINYAKFDIAMGKLIQVNWTLSTTTSVGVQVYNIVGGQQPYTNATATVPITFTCAGPATVATYATAGPFVGYAGFGPNYVGNAPYSVNTMMAPLVMNTCSTDIGAQNLGMYMTDGAGTGSVCVDANTLSTAGTRR